MKCNIVLRLYFYICTKDYHLTIMYKSFLWDFKNKCSKFVLKYVLTPHKIIVSCQTNTLLYRFGLLRDIAVFLYFQNAELFSTVNR